MERGVVTSLLPSHLTPKQVLSPALKVLFLFSPLKGSLLKVVMQNFIPVVSELLVILFMLDHLVFH